MPITMEVTDGSYYENDSWYHATILGFEETEDNLGYGPGIKWLLEREGEEGREQWAFSSQKLSPRSKTYKWVKAIDPDVLPEPGEMFNIEVLAGREVEVEFGPKESDPTSQVVTRIKARKEKNTGQKIREQAAARNRQKAEQTDPDDKF